MFSKQESHKSKCKFGGTKVCKAEEVSKYFENPKIESFRLVFKLHYLQFRFQVYRSSRSQMFFGAGALKNYALSEFPSKNVACLQVCNFIKRDSDGSLDCPFSKFKEMCPDFRKKCPNQVHRFIYGFNFSFQILF